MTSPGKLLELLVEFCNLLMNLRHGKVSGSSEERSETASENADNQGIIVISCERSKTGSRGRQCGWCRSGHDRKKTGPHPGLSAPLDRDRFPTAAQPSTSGQWPL